MYWQTARRKLLLDRPLVMGVINVTPDSFSDGGKFFTADEALRRAERLIGDGADILDIGGESTRPKSTAVAADEEAGRVEPVIAAIAKRFEIPISVDTTKAAVARAAVGVGAEIINDISGLRFDEGVAGAAAESGAGLVLMHSRGTFETMHEQEPAGNILADVAMSFGHSIAAAERHGVKAEQIVLDPGIGFSKSLEQNLELLAKLGKLVGEFGRFPFLVGTSRKSFIGKLLGGVPAADRLPGSIASAALAVWNGAGIVRVHDVAETVKAVKVVAAIRCQL
jgi:dihydropteroate synthase